MIYSQVIQGYIEKSLYYKLFMPYTDVGSFFFFGSIPNFWVASLSQIYDKFAWIFFFFDLQIFSSSQIFKNSAFVIMILKTIHFYCTCSCLYDMGVGRVWHTFHYFSY